ncbi:hypothetical protein Hypma_015054 [Hypsizygus marmoreus]|uniref:Histone deacetylase complex subunit SAP30 Sin3 binding domain-containing protein n=1 Tax=Hypsizygus marmoreus TaxID=39966 RepID=A0A369K1W2_HYPMA|nr:hypothetical protein Hypma_015054 [Hypsizygus marmoreus]
MSGQPTATGSRSRPQARRKPNDDASYFGPPVASTGTKRQAADKADGEPRGKRKRVEPLNTTSSLNRRDVVEPEPKASLVEFVKMPTPVLYRYLNQYDIVPLVYPSPLTAEEPAPPSALEHPFRHSPRAPSPPPMTPANRPHRNPKEQSRRRSSRLLEEETRSRTPILADIDEMHTVLAGIVERHFRETSSISGREEVDTLASFMCAVEKAKGGRGKLMNC